MITRVTTTTTTLRVIGTAVTVVALTKTTTSVLPVLVWTVPKRQIVRCRAINQRGRATGTVMTTTTTVVAAGMVVIVAVTMSRLSTALNANVWILRNPPAMVRAPSLHGRAMETAMTTTIIVAANMTVATAAETMSTPSTVRHVNVLILRPNSLCVESQFA